MERPVNIDSVETPTASSVRNDGSFSMMRSTPERAVGSAAPLLKQGARR
jgi:hypothetical protein